MAKVLTVNLDKCTGCGACVDKCPSIFEMEDGVAFAAGGVVPISEEDRVEDAADECPVEAIVIED